MKSAARLLSFLISTITIAPIVVLTTHIAFANQPLETSLIPKVCENIRSQMKTVAAYYMLPADQVRSDRCASGSFTVTSRKPAGGAGTAPGEDLEVAFETSASPFQVKGTIFLYSRIYTPGDVSWATLNLKLQVTDTRPPAQAVTDYFKRENQNDAVLGKKGSIQITTQTSQPDIEAIKAELQKDISDTTGCSFITTTDFLEGIRKLPLFDVATYLYEMNEAGKVDYLIYYGDPASSRDRKSKCARSRIEFAFKDATRVSIRIDHTEP